MYEVSLAQRSRAVHQMPLVEHLSQGLTLNLLLTFEEH